MNWTMFTKFRFCICVLAASICSVANANDEIDAMQRAMLNLQNQVSQLQDQVDNSTGQIEELTHEKELLQKENSELKAKLQSLAANGPSQATQATDASENSANLQKVSGGGSATLTPSKVQNAKATTVVSNTGPATPAAKAPNAEATALYQSSYKALNEGKFDVAAKGFESFTTKYPDNNLTSNAWYWLGQVQYKQKKYEEARLSFLKTAKFKGSAKRPDALYKLGITSKALGDTDKAKKFFEVLIKTYPTSSSTALAKKELESMK